MIVPDLQELLSKKEDLHPELVGSLSSGAFGDMIHNRFIIEPIYRPEMNALINLRYTLKKDEAEKALVEGQIERFVFMNERPYRFEAFEEVLNRYSISDEKFNSLLSSVWIDSENIFQYFDNWREIWKNSDKSLVMDKDNLKAYKSLPEILTVYRGLDNTTGTLEGMSWTTKRDKAEWFAKRFASTEPVVASVKIHKSKIYAFFNDRNEHEVVIDPDHLEDIVVEDL